MTAQTKIISDQTLNFICTKLKKTFLNKKYFLFYT